MTGPGLAILMLAVMLPAYAVAGPLYQWKDANGVLHFTDNPDAVPAQDRGKSRLEVEPLTGIGSPAGTQAADNDPGRKLWEEKCKVCHNYVNDSTVQGQVGLLPYILNPDTKFPYPEDTIVESLKNAIRGTGEGMPAIDISDADLKSLAEFLAKQVSNY